MIKYPYNQLFMAKVIEHIFSVFLFVY